ncbi:two-component response regulator [Calothrix sp. NIES-2100]|uniref:response regulator n=1 Tax=Calothrix sp. NIES-2100 TaxID=1954172 RepID=UPI000B60887F|nr:two-component response regulator [Calothrix sp. NIES-2100]
MKIVQELAIKTKTILLIDDEANVRELVELCLIDLGGWNVLTVDSPFSGLEKAKIAHPDAIVLDLSMRGSFMFLRELRNHIETKTIPLVLLSATARWLDPQFIKTYKVAGIILKPFDPVTLPIQMSEILKWPALPIHT